MADPKLVMVGADGRPYTNILTKDQRAGHWELSPKRELSVSGGKIAVSGHNDPLRADGGKNLWTSLALDPINANLTDRNSVVHLKVGSAPVLVGHFPHLPDQDPPFMEKEADGTPSEPHTLMPVIPEFPNQFASLPFALATDCGQAATAIMGTTQEKTAFRLRDGTLFPLVDASPQATAMLILATLLVPAKVGDLTAADKTTRRQAQQAALDAYDTKSFDEKDSFDKKHGINRYAQPKDGEAYVIVNLFDSAINSKAPPDLTVLPHHWGAVLFGRSKRRVLITLENFTGNAPRQWYFAIYGNKGLSKNEIRGTGNDTFHGVWSSFGHFVRYSLTFIAQPQ
jgi:hypothetical protein